ncbi:MAG: GNAT family N-acetyltransferase [Dehalococcoidia bacterium]
MTASPVGQGILQQAVAAWRRRACVDFGCEDSAFDCHALTIVARPPDSKEKSIAMAITMGTGTVLSVQEPWIEFARTLTPEKHFLAFQPQEFALPFLEEARRRGVEVVARNPGLGFLPAEAPAPPRLPQGTRVERWQKEQCVPWALTFHNALWDDPDDIDDFLYALVLVDETGAPQAMAGAWRESDALVEIGVDVAHDARGRGLAPVIVRTMARAILDSGNIPTYYCAATNVRSHRTALASGFLPVVSMGGIRPQPPKPTPQSA